jgi:DNA-binding NarL/FixJ family response regulator
MQYKGGPTIKLVDGLDQRHRGPHRERTAHRAASTAGRTNRQIAHELYLSLKTVEGHLARAYDKLDITSRSELNRVLEPEKARVPTR